MSVKNFLVENNEKNVSNNLTNLQKRATIIVSVFGLLIIVFGIYQIIYQLKKPFNVDSNGNKIKTNESRATLDTDHDGLTDQEEMNTYQTSPYLEDSDSDGLSDFQEISEGTDPNCPEGTNCYNSGAVENSNNNEIQSSEGLDSSNIDEVLLQKVLQGESDVQTLRQVLIQSGADPEMLGQISDEDLMSNYQKLLNNQNK